VETYGTGFIRIRNMLGSDTKLLLDEKGNFFIARLEKTTQKTTRKTTQKTTQKTSTQQHIMDIIQQNSKITRKQLSENIDKSESTVKEHLAKMKKQGLIKRIGPPKGGYWTVPGSLK
jgi:ATP-dependent DNA helicase RecG